MEFPALLHVSGGDTAYEHVSGLAARGEKVRWHMTFGRHIVGLTPLALGFASR